MVANNKNTGGDDSKQLPVPLVIGGGILVILFFLFMYHSFVSPLYGTGPKKMERVPPRPGDPDVPPYNTKEWQERTKPGQRMPGVPPVNFPGGPAR